MIFYVWNTVLPEANRWASYPRLLGCNASCFSLYPMEGYLVPKYGQLQKPQTVPLSPPCLATLTVGQLKSAFLRCWLLRCHGCFLYRMGRGEWGARTAPPTQFSSHGFLPRSLPPFRSSLQTETSLSLPTSGFWDYISAPTGCSDFMTRVVITCTIPVIMALWAHTCQPLAKVRAAHLFLQLPYAIGVMLIPVLRVSKQAYPKWLA